MEMGTGTPKRKRDLKWIGGQDKIVLSIWLPNISYANVTAESAPSDLSVYYTNIDPYTTQKQNNHALSQKDYTNKFSTRKLANIGKPITVS